MVSELRVHAATNVVELFVQTLLALQATPVLDSGLVTWLHDPLRPYSFETRITFKIIAEEKMPRRKRGLTTEEIQKLLIDLEDEIFDDSDSDCELENEEDLEINL
ncbi:hypothetical protein TNCV_3995111 [Trichonephila clavipes]|nr:hypothetical protein TNCV_3995111 [Trichonephila clavipes]